ncbi:hypothetical protein DV711_05150 [Motiliproteus coralliicola]|uniref:Uncharacterized protein n=1 Tax=Motiliproteus coralliicola TaxID=2283196 RepID=A0A369WTE2_9GAMM|nr:hypothetical protein [Motiliproteus coralliicola]RDE24962.1 hypothetical protein DV711_05150 [Motiliproteus coralliicola]
MAKLETNSKPNKALIEQTLHSNALMAVIVGRIIIALALAGVAVAAMYFGVQMVLPADPSQASQMILTYKDFSMSAQGLGAVIMMSGVVLGILAFLCKPKLEVRPINNSGLVNRLSNKSINEESKEDNPSNNYYEDDGLIYEQLDNEKEKSLDRENNNERPNVSNHKKAA